MIILAIIAVLLLFAVPVAAMLLTAPEGWEDERGFHTGRQE